MKPHNLSFGLLLEIIVPSFFKLYLSVFHRTTTFIDKYKMEANVQWQKVLFYKVFVQIIVDSSS